VRFLVKGQLHERLDAVALVDHVRAKRAFVRHLVPINQRQHLDQGASLAEEHAVQPLAKLNEMHRDFLRDSIARVA